MHEHNHHMGKGFRHCHLRQFHSATCTGLTEQMEIEQMQIQKSTKGATLRVVKEGGTSDDQDHHKVYGCSVKYMVKYMDVNHKVYDALGRKSGDIACCFEE